MLEEIKNVNVPVLPLRNIVVFPNMVVPLFVGRDKSINALEKVMDKDQELLFLAQKNSEIDDPVNDDLYSVGTKGKILQLLKLHDGTVKVLVEGIQRCKVEGLTITENFISAQITPLEEKFSKSKTITALVRSTISKYEDYSKINNKISSDVLSSVKDIEDESKLADTIASQINISIKEKQELLIALKKINFLAETMLAA